MTRTRKLIIAFWILIIVMLLWQFYDYNRSMTQDAIDHPKQGHFFFYPPSDKVATSAPVHADGADVQQTNFTVENDAPSTGSFTCHVTVKNMGKTKAVGIQVKVRPYRGVSNYDQDVGHQKSTVLTDNDPLSQLGEYVSFPDLAPGESSTQTISFISRDDFKPGSNPNPEIIFQTAKSPSPSAAPAAPADSQRHSQADQ